MYSCDLIMLLGRKLMDHQSNAIRSMVFEIFQSEPLGWMDRHRTRVPYPHNTASMVKWLNSAIKPICQENSNHPASLLPNLQHMMR